MLETLITLMTITEIALILLLVTGEIYDYCRARFSSWSAVPTI
jgi:hypothetical protein